MKVDIPESVFSATNINHQPDDDDEDEDDDDDGVTVSIGNIDTSRLPNNNRDHH